MAFLHSWTRTSFPRQAQESRRRGTCVINRLQISTDLKGFDMVTAVRWLAKQEHSAALAQLGSHISAIMKFGARADDDPFVQVKDLIMNFSRLQEEASSEAYRDEETLEDTEKEDLEADFAEHSSKLEAAVARSIDLDGEISALQSANGEDPFAGLKGLITELISQLQREALDADTAKQSSTLESAVPSSTESLNEGHPDKICEQFSDVVLDTCLTCDAKCKIASETCVKDNMFMVTDEINDTGVSLASEIIEMPVIQTQEKTRQVTNTHVQYVVDTVEVEKSKIIEETVQRMKPVIQEKISQVIKHTDFPLLQFLSKVVDMPVVGQQQASMVVEKTVEIPEIRTIWGTKTSESLNTARTRQNDARQQHEQQHEHQHHNNQQQSTRQAMQQQTEEKERERGERAERRERKGN